NIRNCSSCDECSAKLFDSSRNNTWVGFLYELSSLVRSIHIHQHSHCAIRNHRNFLFGLYDVNWAPIILEMFSRKVDKQLPILGKKVWFTASCIAYPNVCTYLYNNHIVR
ncbi:hypothetical protein PENTCL1PPCAC_5447, partial [Pristionchus entomophagus]